MYLDKQPAMMLPEEPLPFHDVAFDGVARREPSLVAVA
jgi:hypothetical protein